MLEEEHRIVATDRGAEEAVGVERGRGTDHPKPGNRGEHRGTGLRMVRRAAFEIPAVRHPHHHRRAEGVVRAPPQRRQLVPELHVGRPDVVEELDLDHRFEPARSQPDGPANDVGLGQRRVVDAVAPERALQPPGDLEHPTLPLHVAEVPFPAAIRHILAEDHDPRIACHFVAQADVEQVDHGGGIAGEAGIVLGVELLGRGVHVRRVHVAVDRVGGGLG